MLAWLKTHPFAVEAFFERSLVLTFAAPAAEVQALLPAPLVADTWQTEWALLAVALVQTRALRPRGFPVWLGQDFCLVGYRAFVRYVTPAGKRLRGLYILRSETDRRRMALLGNVFTHYGYAPIDLRLTEAKGHLAAASARGDFDLQVTLPTPGEAVALPAGSPFGTWAEARRFAGPLPFTFAVEAARRRVVIVEGVREQWQPQPVTVARAHAGFLKSLPLSQLVLANAFALQNVPYHWKKGRTELWRP
ncbi:DUF2071 domain-containing protein [Hymenobacter sp. BRD128]|uniref:DUF2071 domain-containing protein n=1 Tax=Hymenobacter sp. BRD128 TaxID=2675878 RepID=UPI001566DD32|nr:DUF2071 domain-containing protein [Hymenobacter sp. BRD128]QKG56731.1 DUF2071 domain-containing protein [Hymenobacter sp. BRD128]